MSSLSLELVIRNEHEKVLYHSFFSIIRVTIIITIIITRRITAKCRNILNSEHYIINSVSLETNILIKLESTYMSKVLIGIIASEIFVRDHRLASLEQ